MLSRSWLHFIICTSGLYTITLHHNCKCIYRRPNYFCLIHLQCISEYYFTQSCINSLYKFTTYISGMVRNKMTKTYISLNKSERTMHSWNKINSRNINFWKILVWLTRINPHHSKNDQKLFWPCCIIMGVQELQIIPCCLNRWHHISNK